MTKQIKFSSILITCLLLQGCLGTIVGTTADVAIEVVKLPFKVGGAVVDVVTGDDLSDESKRSKLGTVDADSSAHAMEAEGI